MAFENSGIMKKYISFFLLISNGAIAQQNLVSNPGFESHTQCSYAYNQIWYCVDWTGVPGCPSITDVADYFTGCGASGFAPPDISPAWQMPHGGDSYIGITSASNWGNCREYAQTLLIDSLIPGVKYNVSYYANLAGKSYFCLASNKLGALFTTYEIPDNVSLPALNFAHVFTDTVISDTVGWFHFSSSFIADSSYKFMTIGNFFDAAQTTTIPLNPNASYAWYLIDDVYVGIDSATAIPSIDLYSSDTSFCENQCIDFFDLSTNSPTSWQWYFPGSDSSSSNMQNPSGICYPNHGTYDVTLIACNNIGCDTLVLTDFIQESLPPAMPSVNYSNDTLFSSPGFTYQWYEFTSGIISGAVNQFFVPAHDGLYYVTITDSNGCSATSDYVTINEIRNQIAIHSGFVCYTGPGNDGLTINFNKTLHEKELRLEVYDMAGKEIYLSKITNILQSYSFKLRLEDGIYLIRVHSGSFIYSDKFIVNKSFDH